MIIAGGARILEKIEPVGGDVFRHRPVLRRASTGRCMTRLPTTTRPSRSPAAMSPHDYCQQKAAQSGSSFYYSFLFLPEDRRRAITALYAFCREVDDVVDECTDPGIARTKLAWWRQEIANVYHGKPQHPVARALAEVVGPLSTACRSRAAGSDRRHGDGPRLQRLSRFRGAEGLLPPRRRRRRHAFGRDFRL